ncbi:MAG: D-cysteine desulfhydrase family protein [Bacteroidales bacterium]|nr:D-cysteine desulfhydrase family protein [Bacteroidales bacterium]
MKNKFSLGFFPTPLHKMHNLSRKYQPCELYIKRDDQTGLASGGNKTRKLEYLMAEAVKQGCDTMVTLGAQQSNHCRQTAAACAVAGLECHLIVRGEKPALPDGNLLLSVLLGAKIHYAGSEITDDFVEQVMYVLKSEGKTPYLIPYGGSNITGIFGFVDAMQELRQQLYSLNLDLDYIFFASCSGGTQAGMLLGKELYKIKARLMPVSIQKPEVGFPSLEEFVLELANGAAKSVGIERLFRQSDAELIKGYDEAGYGVVTQNERQAIHELARLEGILLDPVYTARAFYAMTNFLQREIIEPGSKVLFWHTGGLPANFHYGEEIL